MGSRKKIDFKIPTKNLESSITIAQKQNIKKFKTLFIVCSAFQSFLKKVVQAGNTGSV